MPEDNITRTVKSEKDTFHASEISHLLLIIIIVVVVVAVVVTEKSLRQKQNENEYFNISLNADTDQLQYDIVLWSHLRITFLFVNNSTTTDLKSVLLG